METNASITKLINEEIEKLGIPLTALAKNSGIAYATLNRRVRGGGAWTATEIARVAIALRIPASKLLPEEFSPPVDPEIRMVVAA